MAKPTVNDKFPQFFTYVFKSFYIGWCFHKHYGLDAALRKILKLHYFSPKIFLLVLVLPVCKMNRFWAFSPIVLKISSEF